MTPSESARIFESYSCLVPLITDYKSLETVGAQIIEDARLTDNQTDALMALVEVRERILNPSESIPPKANPGRGLDRSSRPLFFRSGEM